MKGSNVLLSALHFMQGSFLILSGLFLLALGKIPDVRWAFCRMIEHHPKHVFNVGMALLAFGSVLFFILYQLYKTRFYQVRMGSADVEVDPALIRSYVLSCITPLDQKVPLFCEVIVHKDQTLEIVTKWPLMAIEEHERKLLQTQQKIASFLQEKMGYKREFLFTVALE
ncbi:MAG: hypothetical protein NT065_03035 [Chlamydiae bacterium]|nr:hypothetical protein [Chlamydiota bacterium]